MLKITRSEYINEDVIECISEYDNYPLRAISSKARKEKGFREFRSKYGVKTIIIMTDMSVILAPFHVDTYFGRIDKERYLVADPNRYLINKSLVREITTRPNAQQRRDIKQAKQEGNYINLAGNKPVKYHVFTTTGRIYALRLIKDEEVRQ